ncbi:MAG: Uma2 family endonuclease [Planctomycetes bacterium]|nr:Uma2 family endonuclease [Planctomycetota bacterium]
MASRGIVFEDRLRIPADVFTLEGFRAWAHSDGFPERGQFSFIGGEVEVDMSPEELETHNKLKGSLFVALSLWIDQSNLGEILADRALLINEGADLATEPDMMFCSWESLQSRRVWYRASLAGSSRLVEVVGSPDLVVEVVSERSVRKDTVLLRDKYFRAGIREYWIADGRGASIRLELLSAGADGYIETPADVEGFLHSRVLNRAFKITRGRNPMGGYSYRVDQR